MSNIEYEIKFNWDNEANVWLATSETVPGLALESGSLDALIERVRLTVPELLELNGVKQNPIPLLFTSERRDQVCA